MADMICLRGVKFQRINERFFKKHGLSNMLFFMVSQSGAIDNPGSIYFFTPTAAFFMDKEDHGDNFIDELLLSGSEWNLINIYFCDFLIINPEIYNSFVHELCARNFSYFWFETAIDIYKQKYCK